MRWAEFAAAAPDLAGIGRDRFSQRNVMVLGTIRADGSPRVSAVNPFFVGDELVIGLMRSAKVADLLRDSRCTLHSAIIDGDGSEGEFKLFGSANQITDPVVRDADPSAWWTGYPLEKATVFGIDIASAAFVMWDWDEGTYETQSWAAGGEVRREVRSYP